MDASGFITALTLGFVGPDLYRCVAFARLFDIPREFAFEPFQLLEGREGTKVSVFHPGTPRSNVFRRALLASSDKADKAGA